MTTQEPNGGASGGEAGGACARVHEHLAELLERRAAPSAASEPARHTLDELEEHIANCDACRDLLFDAGQAVRVAKQAAADYRVPADLVAKLLASADAAPRSRSGATADSVQRPEPRVEVVALDARRTRSPRARWYQFLGGVAAAAALLAFVLWRNLSASSVSPLANAPVASDAPREQVGPWRGQVRQVRRSFGSPSGLRGCNAAGACAELGSGDEFEPGTVLQTDGLSRAELELSDGSRVLLERGTELAFAADASRRAALRRGELIVEIERAGTQPASIDVPNGRVTVLGTKFALRTQADGRSEVDVSRGRVQLADRQGRAVVVAAAQTGRLGPETAPQVQALANLARAFTWGEQALAMNSATPEPVRGLGELRAKRPGSDLEQAGAVSLTRHEVRVRINGAVARTEVEEVFTNNTDSTLEGILRFPLPPDAQIERLALEVDGRWEEGAFVERQRAAAIWRGAIVNSSKRPVKPQDEIVWVPGPWRDPALLEWQSGGRFELRIFPIPARGARRVLLAYTQRLSPVAGQVDYTYPLPHDPSGSTRVADFSLRVAAFGAQGGALESLAYPLQRAEAPLEGGAHYSFERKDFVPAGDVRLSMRLTDPGRELQAFAYGAEPGERYVAMTLAPRLPLSSNNEKSAYVFVIDRSRSMYGEKFERARSLVERSIRELDRDAWVSVLDCDSECTQFEPSFREGSDGLASDVSRYLSRVRPEGASDLMAGIESAVQVGKRAVGRALRIVYVGDGAPNVGEVQPAFVGAAARRLLPVGARVFAVTVGSDSDPSVLEALARAGQGDVLHYAPGEPVGSAALSLLAATYGAALSDVRVTLPAGLDDVAPIQLANLMPGGQLLLTARMNSEFVAGDVVLSGTLGQEVFERRYRVELHAEANPGNAFVPRLFAAEKIRELESDPSAQARARAVELSGRFNVASRHTSLLVLESAAMFKAFGLDNRRSAPIWEGDSAAMDSAAVDSAAVADAAGDELEGFQEADASEAELADDWSREQANGSWFGDGNASRAVGDQSAERKSSGAGGLGRAYAPPPAAKPKKDSSDSESWPSASEPERLARRRPLEPTPRPEPRPTWVPMRKIWERTATLHVPPSVPESASPRALQRLRERFEADSLNRGALKELYAKTLLAGDFAAVEQLAQRWSEKDPLDPDALTARADLAAQRGDRNLALRILGSVLDVRPTDHRAHARLARLFRWSLDPKRACRHSLAAAQLLHNDAELLAQAVSCLRAQALEETAQALLSAADEGTRVRAERLAAAAPATGLSGDFRVSATWSGDATDLDLVLLHPEGYRVSWLGAPTRSVISAQDVLDTGRESLALRGAEVGDYAIEVVRAQPSTRVVRGEVEIRIGKTSRRVPFVLDGASARVATATVQMRSRLVPLE